MVGYNTSINSCEAGMQWACQAHVIPCSAVISTCEKGIEWEKALRLLREMPCRVLLMDMNSHGAAALAIVRTFERAAFKNCVVCPPNDLRCEFDA